MPRQNNCLEGNYKGRWTLLSPGNLSSAWEGSDTVSQRSLGAYQW